MHLVGAGRPVGRWPLKWTKRSTVMLIMCVVTVALLACCCLLHTHRLWRNKTCNFIWPYRCPGKHVEGKTPLPYLLHFTSSNNSLKSILKQFTLKEIIYLAGAGGALKRDIYTRDWIDYYFLTPELNHCWSVASTKDSTGAVLFITKDFSFATWWAMMCATVILIYAWKWNL